MGITQKTLRFHVGQIIRHKLFGYRGVVFNVDPYFCGDDEWYEMVAKSRPPKDQPWYHVMPSGHSHTTYVAERNLEADDSDEPIEHPLLDDLFAGLGSRGYQLRERHN